MWQQRRPAQPPPLAVVKAFRKWRATLMWMWLWMWQQASLLNCLAKQKPPFNRSPSQLQALLCRPVSPPPSLPSPTLPQPGQQLLALAAKRRVVHSPSQYAK